MSSTSKNKSPKKRGCLFFIFIFILIFFAGLLLILALALRPLQPHSVSMLPTEREQEELDAVLQRFSDQLLDENGYVAEEATILLSEYEMDLILRAAMRSVNQLNGEKEMRSAQAFWEDGHLQGDYSYPLPLNLALNFHAALRPALKDSKVRVTVDSVSVGALPLPSAIPEALLGSMLQEMERTERMKRFHSIFKEITVLPDGSVAMTFYPRNISDFTRFLLGDGEN